MIDRHIYYPDRGWHWKWIIGATIFVSGVCSFLYLVMTA